MTKKIPRFRRKVSLFKRRKKSDIRPFVKEKNQREYKKIIRLILLTIVFLFLSSLMLLFVRFVIEQFMVARSQGIISPKGSSMPQAGDVVKQIEIKGYTVENVKNITDSNSITFSIQESTKVYFSLDKNINEEINTLDLVVRQLMLDNKKAISIDLRYNKPIVKF